MKLYNYSVPGCPAAIIIVLKLTFPIAPGEVRLKSAHTIELSVDVANVVDVAGHGL